MNSLMEEEFDLLSALKNKDIISTNVMSKYSDIIVDYIYIVDFVCFKLSKCLKCEDCCQALFAQNMEDFHDLIAVKQNVHLCHLMMLFTMCILCQKIFGEKFFNSAEKKLASKLPIHEGQVLVIQLLSTLQEKKKLFSSLDARMSPSDPSHNHLVLLIKAVAETYF